ncbi:MAG: Eco57I restriction-modification methylase domain-containing protein [Candidatus Hydrogenedentes bacterium]|nr:Eco57I restriction-modification methylase domain-containing protein [Candidatus Hydrogenedentota bacterium]
MLPSAHRSAFGQFLTPADVAAFMASLLKCRHQHVRLLDPGAGTGSLTVAAIEHLLGLKNPPQSVHIVCFEVEDAFLPFLTENLNLCAQHAGEHGVNLTYEIRRQDFLEAAVQLLECAVFGLPAAEQFHLCILNPPYKKIAAASRQRTWIRAIGFETVNLYTGFLGAAAALLCEGGELAGITPRSFCNGPYYKDFRRFFFERMSLQRLHIFESRDKAFKEDDVLQETLITHARKCATRGKVRISSSLTPNGQNQNTMLLPHDSVVIPEDKEQFIRLLSSKEEVNHSIRMDRFNHTLSQLDIGVSTGRVVDFRSKNHLIMQPESDTVPLIYPVHFTDWTISWPAPSGKKSNAIRALPETASMLLPPGYFVLTKRFSAKEEARRVVAVVYEGKKIFDGPVAFENHLNYFHHGHHGLEADLAWGLAAYLNSGMVDSFFRTFNGHTQVNATDLRALHYPSALELSKLGLFARTHRPSAAELDCFLLELAGH